MTALAGLLGLLAAVGAVLLAELEWRSRMRREMAEEVALGVMRPEDLEALTSFRRFRGPWLSDARERRRFRLLVSRLARAKRVQRLAPAPRKSLFQIEVLSQRTRLREIQRILQERTRRAWEGS